MRLPSAWRGKTTCATPVMTSGYTIPRRSVISARRLTAGRMSRTSIRILLSPAGRRQNHVDDFDSGERHDDAAQPIYEQVAAQERTCAERPVLHALDGERYQYDDDQRVENHRREDCGVRRRQVHDIERTQLRVCHRKRG